MSRARAPLARRPSCLPGPGRPGPGRLWTGAAAWLPFLLFAVATPLFEGKAADPEPEEPVLTFVARSRAPRELALSVLVAACGERVVEVDDPYHARPMRYRALPLRCVLDRGFEDRGGAASLAQESLLLRARDGYTRPASGALVADTNAFLAFGEPGLEAGRDGQGRALPAFSPIDRRQIDPAPFYLVWTGVQHGDPHEHPWPYQLVTIEIASFEEAFPHTVPVGLPDADPGWRGYALFQEACSACHAINGEGGKVGPDLNVPMSIVEYRPLAQIRAYVRDPQATRYTSMPAHPHLTTADLDALIAYFEAMRVRKHDPRTGAKP